MTYSIFRYYSDNFDFVVGNILEEDLGEWKDSFIKKNHYKYSQFVIINEQENEIYDFWNLNVS